MRSTSTPKDTEILVVGTAGSRLLSLVAAAAAFAIVAISVFWGLGGFWRLGLEIYSEQPMALILGLALLTVFLTIDARGQPKQVLVRVDIALAAASIALLVYVAFDYPDLTQDLYSNPWSSFAVGAGVVALTAEGIRRCAGGWTLLIIFSVFLVYSVWGHLVPGALQGRSTAFLRIIPILGLDGSAVFGTALEVVSTVVIAFILMGQFLYVTGGGEFFTDLSAALMGRQRGGGGKITVVSSALFGTISGSVVANVTSSGIITIPMMKREGFKPHVAGAIEAVASNGGQIMPPVMGAASFLMADFLGVPYSEIVIAATIPAALYFFAVFVHVDLEAAKNGIRARAEGSLPGLLDTLKQGWIFVAPLALLIYLMFELNMAPETAALISTGAILVLGLFRGYRGKRLRLADIPRAFVNAGLAAVQIVIVCAIAGMLVSIFNVTGLDFGLSLFLIKIGSSSLLLLLLTTAVVCIILGMSLPTTSMYILLVSLVVPALIQLGSIPLAAHMFVFYFGMMSFVTPPVALASFAAANIANADPMKTGWASCYFGWMAYVVPFLFVYSPALLMMGGPVEIVVAVVSALTGIVLVSAGMMGYLRSGLSLPKRALALGLGAGLLAPVEGSEQGLYFKAAAICAGAVALIVEWWLGGQNKRLLQS